MAQSSIEKSEAAEAAADSAAQAELHDEISPFDTASYIYEIAGQLLAMSRSKGFGALSVSLERARDNAARAAIEARKSAQLPAGSAAPDDAA